MSPEEQHRLNELLKNIHAQLDAGHAPAALPRLLKLKEGLPDNVNVLVLLGRAYLALRKFPESLRHYRRAASIMPRNPDINLQYGIALQRSGDLEHALDRFQRVLQEKPDHFFARREQIGTLLAMGRSDEAHEAFLRLRQDTPDEALDETRRNALAITEASFAPERVDPRGAIDTLRRCVEHTDEPELLRAVSAHLVRLHTHLGEHEEAFAWSVRFKNIDKGRWDPDEHSRVIDRLIDTWSDPDAVPVSRAKGVDGSRVVFIVGMPRSGTSLAEQMLAQLDAITPGGELNIIDAQLPMAERPPMPFAPRLPLERPLYSQTLIDAMSRAAMKAYNKIDRRRIVTDKQPYNYAMIPLITRMLPGARFIHCTRDPIACCYSNFTTAFTQLHMHTHDLYWLGRYWADYERVMQAWRRLPGVEMIELNYERLVNDPRDEMGRVIDSLGLEWDDAVLDFHRSDRKVRTVSRRQVQRPLYTSSIDRHTRVEHLLGELKRGIEEGRARSHAG